MIPFKNENKAVTLVFDLRGLDFVEHMLYARSIMYARCYEEDVKASAEGMLISAVHEFLPSEVDKKSIHDLMLLDDETLLNILLTSTANGSHISHESASDRLQKAASIARMLKLGRTYVKIFETRKEHSQKVRSYISDQVGGVSENANPISSSQFLTPQAWTRDILGNAGLRYEDEGWQVLIVPPSPNVYRETEANVYILEEKSAGFAGRPASSFSPTLEKIQEVIQTSQQKVRVFVHPDMEENYKSNIAKKAEDYFA